MRTWRVGTVSMGLALLSLGIFLFLSKILKLDLSAVLLAWWPVILIVIGIEILVYLYLNKKENSPIKYDFISIIFVGLIGFFGIGMAAASSIGVFDKIESVVAAETKIIDLPVFNEETEDSIKRIVVETVYPITIESTNEKNVKAFGTLQVNVSKNESIIKKSEDYILSQKSGDTLYLKFKNMPPEYYSNQNLTLLVPANLDLEVNGSYHEVTLRIRTLLGNWSVDRMAGVNILPSNGVSLKVDAREVQQVNDEAEGWNVEPIKESKNNEEITQSAEAADENYAYSPKNATYILGEGTNLVTITNTDSVNIEIRN